MASVHISPLLPTALLNLLTYVFMLVVVLFCREVPTHSQNKSAFSHLLPKTFVYISVLSEDVKFKIGNCNLPEKNVTKESHLKTPSVFIHVV